MKNLLAVISIMLSLQCSAEQVDLTQDALYHCLETVSVGLIEGKKHDLQPDKFTVKVKQGLFEVGKPVKLSNTGKGEFIILEDSIFAAGLNGTIFMESQAGGIVFTLAFGKYAKNIPNVSSYYSFMSQGTCTKW